jgi:hypothetical protein
MSNGQRSSNSIFAFAENNGRKRGRQTILSPGVTAMGGMFPAMREAENKQGALPVNQTLAVQAIQYKVIDFTFTAANVDVQYIFRGNFIYFIYGTSTAGTVPILTIRLGDKSHDGIKFTPGVSFRGFAFDQLWISNDIVGTEMGQLVLGYDPSFSERVGVT